MTVSSKLLRQLSALPDWAVLTDQQTSQVLGLSVDTLRRLDRDRNGPPWVKLSPRRRGRPVGGLRKWIKQRVSASFHEPQMRAPPTQSAASTKQMPHHRVSLTQKYASRPTAPRFRRQIVCKRRIKFSP
jgi:hypothetical protein